MAIPCASCPFTHTDKAEVGQNSGCLPTPYQIITMKVETGNNWACHDNCNRVCQGMIQYGHELPHGKDLDFTKGELIVDPEIHDMKQYTGGFSDIPQHWGSCETCVSRVPVMSHPWYDGKPATNQIGWGCAVSFSFKEEKPFISMLHPGSAGCELHVNFKNNS